MGDGAPRRVNKRGGMKFPHKSSVARVVQHRRRGFFAGFARCLRVSATSVAGRINQNAGHSLAGRVPTPEISHFCPRNASIYIIFPINSSGEALPTRLGTLLHRTYAPSFPPSCADSPAKHVLPERVHPPSSPLSYRFCALPKRTASFTSLET